MNRDLLPELRILSGTHAGARALLGEGPYVLGSDANADFVLSDEGIAPAHVRVAWDSTGVALLYWLDGYDMGEAADEREPPQRVARGEMVRVGPIVITVDGAGAEWPLDVPDMSPQAPLEAPEASPVSAQAEAAPGAVQKTAVDNPVQGDPSHRRNVLVLGAVLLASLVCLWWAFRHTTGAEVVPVAPVDTTASELASQRQEVISIVQQLGMATRVVVGEPDVRRDRLELTAYMLSESESEILSAAMAGLAPRPGIRLVGEQELTLAVDEALRRHADRLQTRLFARHVGQGRFRIQGSVSDEVQRRALLSSMAAEFPGLPPFQDGLQDKTAVGRLMVQELRAQGIRDITSTWEEGVLALTVRLSQADVPRWEQVLRETAQRFDIPFKATLDLSGQATPMIVALPVRIRSVVSGDVPYLVLADGEKMFVDGRRNGWRLVDVDAGSVVFEGPNARRIVVNR